jgi:hypothetical protein
MNVRRKTLAANAIFAAHCLVCVLGAIGWYFPLLHTIWVTGMLVSLVLGNTLGYCILSKWEFDIRKQIEPQTNYDYAWSTFYTHKLTNGKISDGTIRSILNILMITALVTFFYFNY